MAKMLEDAFRTLGILQEDDPSHVAKTVLEVVILPKKKRSKDAGDKRSKDDEENKDHVIIQITPYESR